MKYILAVFVLLGLAFILLPAAPAEALPPPDILSKGLQIEPPNPGMLDNFEQLQQQGGHLPNLGDIAGRGSLVASPPTGNFNLLVVLVDFSDNTGTVAPAFFDNLVFAPAGSGVASVTDYYDEISYGNLTFVTLDYPSATLWQRPLAPKTYNGPTGYINANGVPDPPGTLIDDYGFGAFPQNLQGIVADTLPLIDAQGVDFSNYDNDGDGFVDGILYVYAGPGAEVTANPSDIWSSAWNMTDGAGPGPLMYDNVWIDRFAFDSEYMLIPGDQTIGIYCHEIGHLLFGLPDLYDYDYSSAGLGAWSLMAVGSWNDPTGTWTGSHPAWPDAWSRALMGFETPTLLYGNTAASPGYPFQPVENLGGPGTGQVVRLESPNLGPDEYFLVEYRDNTTASYDSALPGSGLLIYHVDEEKWNGWEGNDFECLATPCCGCPAFHPLVALAQADGNLDLENFNNYGDATDPFNLTGQTFGFGTNPESGSYLACGDSCIAVYGLVAQPWLITAGINVVCTNPVMGCLSMDISEPIGWAMDGTDATYEVTVRNCSSAFEPAVVLTVPPGGWPVSFFDLNTGQPIPSPGASIFPGGAWRLGMRVSVPPGTPRGIGNAVNLQVNGSNGGAAAAVAQTQVPECILLVDDDRGLPNESIYMMALQANKLYYDYWDVMTNGPPDPGALAAHEMVIWFTGNGPNHYATLTPHDEAALTAYLNGGGNLLLSSQDYLWDVGPTYFSTVSMHIWDYTDDITTTQQIQGATGNPFFGHISPPLPLIPSTIYTDIVLPLPPAFVAFESLPGPFSSGIAYDSGAGKVLFLAWPFENLPQPGANMIMLAAADWMGVPPIPMASFTVTPTLACSASPIVFTNTSLHATQYLWDFGDGITSTLTSPTHTYTVSAPVTYTVMLRGANCCGQSFFHQLLPVTPLPTAGFAASAAAALVSQALTFTNTSQYADAYLWDFGDGLTSTLTDTAHAYAAPGTYTVTLMATNACQTASHMQTVTVYGQAAAGFAVSASTVGVGQTVYFTNQSLYADTYQWDFGDGVGSSTSPNPSYAYSAAGTYTVTLTAANLLSTDVAQAVILVEDGPALSSIYLPTLNRGAVGGLKVLNKP